MSASIRLVNTTFRFVIDTTTLISYFSRVFGQPSKISPQGLVYVDKVFRGHLNYAMIIPSIVFVEIFDKWFRERSNSSEEFRAKFLAEVYKPIKANPNIEIREMDIEVIENFLRLDDSLINLENRDKIILASAITLNVALITSDRKIKKYFAKHRIIPQIIT